MTTKTLGRQPDLQLTLTEAGAGRPALILHGGGGPITVGSIAGHVAPSMRAITPTHPGWNGTVRPDWFRSIDDLALAYLRHLAESDLHDVLVIGSSLGGWIASEMATRDSAGLISGLVLIGATGVEIESQPMADFFALDARGIAEHAFNDPDRFFVDPATVPAEQAARQRANMATMRAVAGERMSDPTLLQRLGSVNLPVLAIWGDSDRIVTPAYGSAYAAAFPNARFEIVKDAGHLPHLEKPAATFALIDAFVGDLQHHR